ncbi:SIMPL domain-containing protein [Bacillus thuringiensis]
MRYEKNHYGYHCETTNPNTEATITVQGEGIIKAKPNIVIVMLGIQTNNKDVKQAQDENALQSKQVLDALKQLPIADTDIKTISYTITPQYEYINDQAVLQDYRVEQIYEITVLNAQKAGEVYEVAVSNGANVATGLRFQLSDANTYYEKALMQALQQAKTKARVIADTYKLNIHSVPLSLVEESSSFPQESMSYSTLNAKTAPSIQLGELEIIATIRAIFSIYQ